ncbi:MAG: hypothetical protein IJV70_01715, partial [Clostridia bacterium]|nr:hypothetical protein [Clostridia bacterium]
NLFEVFVNCGVKTVIGFNQNVCADAVTAFATTFFQLLYNVPAGSQTEGSTPGLSVRQVIQTMQNSSTTNYQYYAELFASNSLVIGGSDTMVFDEVNN